MHELVRRMGGSVMARQPTPSLEDLQATIDETYSFVDVLAWALAKTNNTRFVTDTSRWVEAVRELREAHPSLVAGIWITDRAYSGEIQEFFRVMARSGAIRIENPLYESFSISGESKQSISDSIPRILREHEDAISDIAVRLEALSE